MHAVLVDARLVGERVAADDRLVGLDREAGQVADEPAGGGDLLGGDARLPSSGNWVGRVRSAITTSSSEALPARSPRPLIVTSTWRAPAWTAASVLAVASPRSLWQWTLTVACVADELDDPPDERAELGRDGVADGVRDVDRRGAGLDDRLVDLEQELGVACARRPRRRTRSRRRGRAARGRSGPTDRLGQRRLAVDPELVLEVDVARSR